MEHTPSTDAVGNGILSGSPLSLFLFTQDVTLATRAAAAGVDGLVIDWERAGKTERQSGYSTQINLDTIDDLMRLRRALPAMPIIVRVDSAPDTIGEQIDRAISGGATLLMQPMARTARDVEWFLRRVDGRADTIVQIETDELARTSADLGTLPWHSAYIGLNDLAISRGGGCIFDAFVDGTVENIFEALPGRRIGVGGATTVVGGRPLPFPLLLTEMARLGCAFTFLRRSFLREIMDRDMASELTAIASLWSSLTRRGSAAIASDRAAFRRTVREASLSIKE